TFSLEWRSGPDQVVADVAAVTDVVAGEATDVIATAVGIGSGVNTKAGDVGTYITADHLVAGSALPIPGQCNAGSKGHAAPLSGSHVETRNFVVANVGTCAGRKHTEQITGSIDKKTGHRIVDDVGICIDAEGESFARGAAGVVDPVAPYQVVVALHEDSAIQVVVQPVVFHQVAGAIITFQMDAAVEPADIAVAHGGVLPVVGVDAGSHRAIARGQAADLETVAVDGDVVGGDGDGVAEGDVGGQVLAQAPHALFGNGGGHRVDEAGAGVVGFRGLGRRRGGQQAAEQQQGGQQAVGGGGHGMFLDRMACNGSGVVARAAGAGGRG